MRVIKKQYYQDKGFIGRILFFHIAFIICCTSCNKLAAQGFDISARASWVKVDIDISRKDVFSTKDYNNGMEVGPMVTFRPRNTLFAFNSGLLYNVMFYENHNLNFLSTPLGLNIEMGKKAGVVLGFGVRFWYLLKVPDEFLEYHSKDMMNRFLFSYTAQLGIFYKVNNLRFQLCPQIEYFQTPLYYEYSWNHGKDYYYLNMVSYNLTVSF